MSVRDVEAKLGTPSAMAEPLDAALAGAVYPLNREELVLVARENEAPPLLVTLLSGLGPGDFRSQRAVEEALDGRERDAAAEQPSGPSWRADVGGPVE